MYYGIDPLAARFTRLPAEPAPAALYREEYYHAHREPKTKPQTRPWDARAAELSRADAIVTMARHAGLI